MGRDGTIVSVNLLLSSSVRDELRHFNHLPACAAAIVRLIRENLPSTWKDRTFLFDAYSKASAQVLGRLDAKGFNALPISGPKELNHHGTIFRELS